MVENDNKIEKSESQAEPVAVETQQEEVGQLDYKDLFLRVSADLQNFQRRVEKQKQEWTVIAQESIILKLIPLIEDMDRALSKVPESDKPEIAQWAQGLDVIQKNLKKTLHELGVEEIPTDGMFDPELHEAIAQIDSPLEQPGKIVEVISKGYRFRDKIIKFSRVAVAK
jgi:molecular chaperone GrpE